VRLDDGTPYILRKDLILGNNCFFHNRVLINEVYQSEFTLDKLHVHDFIEISFVSSGSGIHRIWSDARECKKGDINILQIGTPHGYFANSEALKPVVRNILFDPADLWEGEFSDFSCQQFCRGIFRKNSMLAHFSVHGDTYDQVVAIFDLIQKELTQKAPDWKEVIKAQINTLLILGSRLETGDVSDSKAQAIALNVMRYVAANFADPHLTLSVVAQQHYLSQAGLSRLFHKATGTYFSDYLRNIRLRQACILLSGGELTVEQVAAHCGYSDLPTFYRLFKTHFGMTPHQYRKMHRP